MNDEEKKARTEAAEPYNEEKRRAELQKLAAWGQKNRAKHGRKLVTEEWISAKIDKIVAREKQERGIGNS